MCSVPSIVVLCSSFNFVFPVTLLSYCLSDFEMVPVVITIIIIIIIIIIIMAV